MLEHFQQQNHSVALSYRYNQKLSFIVKPFWQVLSFINHLNLYVCLFGIVTCRFGVFRAIRIWMLKLCLFFDQFMKLLIYWSLVKLLHFVQLSACNWELQEIKSLFVLWKWCWRQVLVISPFIGLNLER